MMEWPRMDVDQGPGLLWAKVTLGEEGRRILVESGPRHQVQPPPSVGANHPAHLPTCGASKWNKWSIQWMKLHSQDIICVYLYNTICHKTPAIPHQGSKNCSILPSRMGEHGVSWENTENMEKIENINQMTSKHYICDSKHSFWPPEDS